MTCMVNSLEIWRVMLVINANFQGEPSAIFLKQFFFFLRYIRNLAGCLSCAICLWLCCTFTWMIKAYFAVSPSFCGLLFCSPSLSLQQGFASLRRPSTQQCPLPSIWQLGSGISQGWLWTPALCYWPNRKGDLLSDLLFANKEPKTRSLSDKWLRKDLGCPMLHVKSTFTSPEIQGFWTESQSGNASGVISIAALYPLPLPNSPAQAFISRVRKLSPWDIQSFAQVRVASSLL